MSCAAGRSKSHHAGRPEVSGPRVRRQNLPTGVAGVAHRRGARETAQPASWFSSLNTEHVTYRNLPPAASSRHKASIMLACVRGKFVDIGGRRSHLISGWRRVTPDAEHGTSARMRSNGGAVPPASRGRTHRRRQDCAVRPSRSRLARTRCRRSASLSSAVSRMSAISSRCALLPPGAAQASSTRMPFCTSSRSAARCADSVLHAHQSLRESRAAAPPAWVCPAPRHGFQTPQRRCPACASRARYASRVTRRVFTRSVNGA